MKPERPSRVGDNVATGDRETAVKSITARETASISRLSDRSLRYVRTYVRTYPPPFSLSTHLHAKSPIQIARSP